MRVLVTIPHFFRTEAVAGHGSEKGDTAGRAAAMTACLTTLRQTFGYGQAHMENSGRRCNGRLGTDIDIVVCTTGDAHLVAHLPGHLFRHHATNAEPRLLGYECHTILAEALGRYDYYGFMEDDLLLTDPLYFWKIGWFSQVVGGDAVLQPHRFELSPDPPVQKLYIDRALGDPTISPRFQNRSQQPSLTGRVMGRDVGFERPDNPHAGCFFLTDAQMAHWTRQPYFLDRADGFWGPLESAATLGLMRTFRVYKPISANAGFLEIQHLDRRYLGTRVRYAEGFRLSPGEAQGAARKS